MLKQYHVVIQGNDIFYHGCIVDAKTFDEALQQAKTIMEQLGKITLEQTRITCIEETEP